MLPVIMLLFCDDLMSFSLQILPQFTEFVKNYIGKSEAFEFFTTYYIRNQFMYNMEILKFAKCCMLYSSFFVLSRTGISNIARESDILCILEIYEVQFKIDNFTKVNLCSFTIIKHPTTPGNISCY